LRSRLFGTLTDNVFWAAHCPVAVTRLLDEPIQLKRILVPVKNTLINTLRTVRFAQLFANANQSTVTLLHICDRRTPPEQTHAFETELSQWLSQSPFQVATELKIVASEDAAKTILQFSQSHDLVIMRSMRRRTVAGLAVSDVTTDVIQALTCSVILFGEPHR
jgi:nucleotide-binding universal stress UspA family protein